MKIIFYLSSLILLSCTKNSQTDKKDIFQLTHSIDSILQTSDFSGVVLIQQKGKTIYECTKGWGDIATNAEMNLSDQFVIGSISKQITAVLVMCAVEQGKIELNQTIDQYLPKLDMAWQKEVTIHQLLTHTHGIVSEDKPLAFKPGSQFSYSQFGYELLARILEAVEHKSFQEISTDFFQKHGLDDSYHPMNESYKHLVNGYEMQNNGAVTLAVNSLDNYAAAGSFISTARNLSKWNYLLHHGKLVKKETYELMQKDHAIRRNHTILDSVMYGYGLMFKKGKNEIEIGTFGYVPGFASTSFYYPKSASSLVILSNYINDPNDLQKVFFVHKELMRLMRTVH